MKMIWGAAWRIVAIILVGMTLFIAVPGIVTLLPSLM
jgi:hypothetical protein